MTKSLPCCITLLAQEDYDLPFAPKEKPLLFNKGNRSLNLLQPFHIYANYLSHLAPTVLTKKIRKPVHIFKILTI